MRRLMVLAPVVALAIGVAACSGDAFNSPTSPGVDLGSTTEARGGNGGKPGGGGAVPTGGGSLALVMVVDRLTSGTSFTDTVTFDVSTSSTAYPWVTVKCYQNGGLVMQQSAGIFAGSLGQIFQLGPTGNWGGGAANCTATLENWDAYSKHRTVTPIASISFDAAG